MGRSGAGRYLMFAVLLSAGWWLVYRSLAPVSAWLTYSAFGLSRGGHFASAVEFFIFEVPKVLMLLVLVVFGVGIIRSFFTPERTRRMLAGRRESVGNVLAALLGVVTPFCSCSAVPLFIGFVTAGVPLGVTFSFLISAPMVNEVALVLLAGMFGWKVAGLYLGTGLLTAIVAGWIIGRLRMEKYVEEWVCTRCRSAMRAMQIGRRPGPTGFVMDEMLSATSLAGCGRSWSWASQSGRGFTVTCRPTRWPRSWARTCGGRSRFRWRSAYRCTRTRRGSFRSFTLFLRKGRRWARCWRS